MKRQPAARFRDSGAPALEAAFSPDARWLVTSADDGLVTHWRLSVDAGTR